MARILEAGGRVDYSHHYEAIHNDSWVRDPSATPPGPAWLHRTLGDDYFTTVISVDLGDATAKCIDDFLPAVGDLSSLRFLDMQNRGVTDAGLAHIGGLTLLEALHLAGTDITDAGMSHLAALDNLVDLSIDSTSVSDAGLGKARIENKRRLRYISMIATQVSNGSLSRLEHIPNLSLVACASTNVTPEGIDRFKGARPDVDVIGDGSVVDPDGFGGNRDPFAAETSK